MAAFRQHMDEDELGEEGVEDMINIL